MDVWKQYFYAALNSKDNVDEEVIYQGPKEQIEAPAKDEVWEIIRRFKNNKSLGENSISAEFIKYGDKKLWEEMYTLIKKYGHQKRCQRTAIICPIHNKGDKVQCSSCRGMCVLSVCYKVLNNILHRQPVPYAEEILGEYQHGFRKGWLTTDNLFMLRYILEKFYEHSLDLHLLFIDIKQAYDQ
jgi:hypothetical protein